MSIIRRVLQSHQSYQIYHSFPEFLGGIYGDSFKDVRRPDGYTILSFDSFWLLMNIRLGHLVYCQGITCYMESLVDLSVSSAIPSFM